MRPRDADFLTKKKKKRPRGSDFLAARVTLPANVWNFPAGKPTLRPNRVDFAPAARIFCTGQVFLWQELLKALPAGVIFRQRGVFFLPVRGVFRQQ